MEYDSSSIRRQDRLLEKSEAVRLLREGEYGFLSLCDGDRAYGIPVDYAWDGNTSIFIHCAPEGRKLRILEKNPRVSFCVVGPTRVISHLFTTEYESIVAQGTAFVVGTDKRKTPRPGTDSRQIFPLERGDRTEIYGKVAPPYCNDPHGHQNLVGKMQENEITA